MKNPTKKQEETLREFLHSAVVPLIEDVLVKKLGQAMSYAKEQLAPPSKQDVNQELVDALTSIAEYWNQGTNHDAMVDACHYMTDTARATLAKHKEQA